MTMRRARGFTLIELMVVVAVMALLLAIAIPAYRDSVRKSRRAVAQTCLLEYSQYMERFYTTNLKYHETRATPAVAVTLPAACTHDIRDFYTLGFDSAKPVTATTYNLTAVPQGDQSQDACGTLKIDNTGKREQTGTATDCWK